MKKIISLIVLLGLIVIASPKPAQAQMAAAQQVSWDVSKIATVKAEQDAVWDLLSNLKEITVYGKGTVKSVEIIGTSLPYDRVLTFSDGAKRKEQIDQIDQRYKFMAYRFKDESLPKGIEKVSIAVFTKDNNGNTEVKWLARIEGNKDAKMSLVEQLTKEAEVYLSGMANLFNNAIPAMKMN
ncbi:hypothetical protein [Solitalea lacus]|uniref:hypothetical protein n=1 Tax=Solitalea lacus TaxID=2911172 RepID=UPI001EDA22F3|nr:hypothetical protein [Solitalea lacus]UKJ07645.1 hypothetical protein L2B55_00425 [Solitalea lacus]